jgi:hypothetical protein
MNKTFALVLLLVLASSARVGPGSCATCEEKTLGCLQTLCDDGTRAVSTDKRTLDRWETTITTSLKPTCTGTMNPRTRQVEVHCRS